MLDTHVWLDLFLFDDPRVQALARGLARADVVAIADPRMQDELVRVLGYPAFALDAARQAAIAARAASLWTPVDTPRPSQSLPRCSDPDDQMFVEVAVAHAPVALLTRDAALLRLAGRLRAFGVEVAEPAAWCAARAAAQISKR